MHGFALANQSQKQADEACAQQQEFWMDPSLASHYSVIHTAWVWALCTDQDYRNCSLLVVVSSIQLGYVVD